MSRALALSKVERYREEETIMSEEPRVTAVEIEQGGVLSPVEGLSQEEARRTQLFRTTALVIVGAVVVILVLFIVIGFLAPQFPARYIVAVAVGFILMTLFSLWLSQQGRLSLAVGIYLVSITVAVFIASHFLKGVSGPLVVTPITITVMAGLIGGGKAARWMALVNAVLYLAMTILEALGVLKPWEVSGMPLWLIESVAFLAALGTIVLVTGTFADLTRRALSTAQQRGRELAEASRQAQQAAQAEREAREREERAARQLRRAVQEYTAFLERVAAGDYSAMLTLDEAEQGGEVAPELHTLGDHLNSTVETLVTALSGMQILQQRYLRDAWEGFAQTGAVHRGFRYHAPSTGSGRGPSTGSGRGPSTGSGRGPSTGSGRGAAVEPDDEAWLTPMEKAAPMEKAVQDKDATVSERELALPITLRGQIIGAIGARRPSTGSGSQEEMAGWSDEDVALVTAITDQLAQTMESLRLLDETQRRAVRERMTREITDKMRRAVDMDDLMKTAIREMAAALGTSSTFVQLTTPGAAGDEKD
jgi:hypothetical protein